MSSLQFQVLLGYGLHLLEGNLIVGPGMGKDGVFDISGIVEEF